MNVKASLFASVCVISCMAFASAGNPQMLDKAKRGGIDHVKVSWFGFDPGDSTRYVQAAFDSNVRKVVIDRMPQGPWVVCPLFLRKNGKEIVFEDGSELLAKRGEYLSERASLLNLKRVKDTVIRGKGTIRMWHDDYLKPPYPLAEWRHGISATSVENLTLDGITVKDAGGDGLYIGVAGDDHVPCRDVVVRNCVFDRNSRQGISVISVDGFTVENTAMNNTIGRPPQSGIDFEPNHVAHVFKRCLLRGCEFSGNRGSGVEVYLVNFNAESDPVDIRLENCRISDNGRSFSYAVDLGGISNPFYDGTVVFDGCTMERARMYAVSIKRRKFAYGKTVLRNCRIVDSCTECPTNAEVHVEVKGMMGFEPDCIEFDNLSIIQPHRRGWISIDGDKVFEGTPTAISGRVEIESPEGKVIDNLDWKWQAARFPHRNCPALPKAVSTDLSKATVHDARPGEMERYDPVYVRGKNKFYHMFYADSARKIRFRGVQMKIGKRKPSEIPLYFHNMKEWKVVVHSPMPGFKEAEFSFDAPTAGFYRMSVDTKGNGFAVTASDAPIAFNVSRENVALVYPSGRLYLYVPENESASCLLAGGSEKEGCGLEVFDRDGVCVYRKADIFSPASIDLPKEDVGRLRTLKITPPDKGISEDMCFGVLGVPGFLFLGPDRYWK